MILFKSSFFFLLIVQTAEAYFQRKNIDRRICKVIPDSEQSEKNKGRPLSHLNWINKFTLKKQTNQIQQSL